MRKRAGSGVILCRFKSWLLRLPVVGFRQATAAVIQFPQVSDEDNNWLRSLHRKHFAQCLVSTPYVSNVIVISLAVLLVLKARMLPSEFQRGTFLKAPWISSRKVRRSPFPQAEVNPKLYPITQAEYLRRNPKQIGISTLDFTLFLLLASCQPPDLITYRVNKCAALWNMPRYKMAPQKVVSHFSVGRSAPPLTKKRGVWANLIMKTFSNIDAVVTCLFMFNLVN